MTEHSAENDADEDEFNQCPHEAIRATCPGCTCPCSGCDRWRARDAARVFPPEGTHDE
jgi:hypothetical protein